MSTSFSYLFVGAFLLVALIVVAVVLSASSSRRRKRSAGDARSFDSDGQFLSRSTEAAPVKPAAPGELDPIAGISGSGTAGLGVSRPEIGEPGPGEGTRGSGPV